MNHQLIKLSALIGLLVLPLTAHADLFSMYVSGKGSYANGSSNAFNHLDSTMGAGAEAGLELVHVDIWGEALNMGADQFYFTANLGFDVTFGQKWRCNLGFYTGPVLFMRPEQTSEPFALSGTMRSALSAAGIDPTMVESQYALRKVSTVGTVISWNGVLSGILRSSTLDSHSFHLPPTK